MYANNKASITSPKKGQKPIIISGPCSAETETQIMEIAESLAISKKVHLFRAGIWKPRTRPGSFEGVGIQGLRWLQQVKQEYNLPCAIEVAKAKHVYEAVKYDIDTVWIGARTTSNPFAIQEIAAALRGAKMKVMVKNPINPDAELWTGAIERIMKADINQISLIHRGFSIHDKQTYRNAPHWDIALELRRRFPELPLICDPSHMGGDRKYLLEISLKALALQYDGLMIETHPNPQVALSDAKQQITSNELLELLLQIAVTKPNLKTHSIPELRDEIDLIDDQLLEIIEKRMVLARQIGMLKQITNQSILQSDRWGQIISRLRTKGKEKGLSDVLIDHIFTAIHDESIQKQTTEAI